jgi:hypothetical protein
MRNFIRTICGVAFSAMAVLPAAAEEGAFVANFGALAVGKITTLTPTQVFWSGAFSGAVFDAAGGPFDHAFVTCPGTNDLDFAAGTSVLSGYCLVTDGADSAIVVTFSCTGAPGICADGTAAWNDGSGKWQGWTADATWTAQLGQPQEDGSISTYAVWTVN